MDYIVGEVYEGIITGITQFGVFVELFPLNEKGGQIPFTPETKKKSVSGMVHISEIAEGFIKDINEFVKEGQKVNVKYLGFNAQKKITLSIKQAVAAVNTPPQQNFEDMLKKFTKGTEEKLGEYRRRAEGKGNKKRR
ncbi:MAG: S1 RNA-binding domain-containing protein [Oscillospiraceae bacterium]|jgi:S1 RNA binding domain protein|nr:S1 RNA-binding domain-containing protein [Oscillospiraceae bacterium]